MNVRLVDIGKLIAFTDPLDMRQFAPDGTHYVQVEFLDESVGPVLPVYLSDFADAKPPK